MKINNIEVALFSKDGKVFANSKDVAEVFEKRHDNVIRDIGNLSERTLFNFEAKASFKKTKEKVFKEDGVRFEIIEVETRIIDQYYMNRDGFMILVMGFTGRKAEEWKLDFIEAFNLMEKELLKPISLPQNYIEALKALVVAEEEKEKIAIANEALALELKNKEEEQKILAPKAMFADSVAKSEHSILIGNYAKAISNSDFTIGQNQLFQWLRDNNYLQSHGDRYNMPTQMAINLKVLETTERLIHTPASGTRIVFTTLITGKGQVYFLKKIKESSEKKIA